MHICVTGGGGFVGSALIPALVDCGYSVVALSRSRPAAWYRELPVKWLEWEVDDPFGPVNAFGSVDVVVHLAGRAHILHEQSKNPLLEFHKSNVICTENLARIAADCGVRRFVYVSSIGVYGSALRGTKPTTEDTQPAPDEPYGQSKLEAERSLWRIAGETGLEIVVVRPALVVGSGAPGNLARLRALVSRGIPILVPSQDNQRSFVTLNNLVDLLIRCIDKPAAAGEVFVAAESEWPSTRIVLKWIGEGLGRRVLTIPVPCRLLRSAAGMIGKSGLYDKVFGNLCVDASKARQKLDWKPLESLVDAFHGLATGHPYSKERGLYGE